MKAYLINKCPTWAFPSLYNFYSRFAHKGHIEKAIYPFNSWNITKDKLTLLSPTPKFLGFGMNEFENKFERLFKIEQGDLCLDVGPCIGDTSVPMALKTGKQGKVIAVEPDATNIQYLRLNLFNLHSTHFQLVKKAVWSTITELPFYLHGTPTGHSLVKEKTRKETVMVETTTLDELWSEYGNIKFAKLDVQGAEAEVLKGGTKQFLGQVSKLVVETHGNNTSHSTCSDVVRLLGQYCDSVRWMDGIVYARNE